MLNDNIYQVYNSDNAIFYVVDTTKISLKKFGALSPMQKIMMADVATSNREAAQQHADALNEIAAN